MGLKFQIIVPIAAIHPKTDFLHGTCSLARYALYYYIHYTVPLLLYTVPLLLYTLYMLGGDLTARPETQR